MPRLIIILSDSGRHHPSIHPTTVTAVDGGCGCWARGLFSYLGIAANITRVENIQVSLNLSPGIRIVLGLECWLVRREREEEGEKE